MWVECHGRFVRQLRFHHVSLREVIHTYMHTQPISVPSETVAYFEPPALIVYLMFRGEESRCNLYVGAPRIYSEMADGNTRL